jgi:F0F1-type ATP synthase assembly protein I
MAGERDNVWVLVGKYSSLAMILPASAAVGFVAGYLLDRWFGTSFLRVALLILGIVGGLVDVVRTLLKDPDIQ